jgi:DNA invertase Pin-like site-specific DNA recombinase
MLPVTSSSPTRGFAGCLADHKSEKGGRPVRSDKGDKFARAVELKNQGMSFRDIAKELGLPRSTVARWLKEDDEIQ